MNKDLIMDASPEEVFHRLHQFVKNYDADGQADLFSEHGIWEFPFAPEGVPRQVVGRENIRKVGKMGMERSRHRGRKITGYASVVIHKTDDPTTIIVEFLLEGAVDSTQTTYQIPYLQLLRVDKGEIVLLRDYFPGEILKGALS